MNIFFNRPFGHYIGLDRTVIPTIEPVLETLIEPIFTGVSVYDTNNIAAILSTDSISPIEYTTILHGVLPII